MITRAGSEGAPSFLRRTLRDGRMLSERAFGNVQALVQGKIEVLPGVELAALRAMVVDSPANPHRAGISNCGLLRTAGGYLGIVKSNTYHFCDECGISAGYGPRHVPASALLLQVELDEALSVTRVERLRIEGAAIADGDLIEDARLLEFAGEIWVSLNRVPGGRQALAMPVLGRLDRATATLRAVSLELPGERPPQKNWMPFAAGGRLYLQHAVNPHVVYELDPERGVPKNRWSSSFATPMFSTRGPFYRGSTPLVAWDGGLLGAAHCHVLRGKDRHYRTHFYLTEPEPPFAIVRFGRPVKLLRPHRIQFVSALLREPSSGDLLVSFGIEDCDNWIVKVSSDRMAETLRPVRRWPWAPRGR